MYKILSDKIVSFKEIQDYSCSTLGFFLIKKLGYLGPLRRSFGGASETDDVLVGNTGNSLPILYNSVYSQSAWSWGI